MKFIRQSTGRESSSQLEDPFLFGAFDIRLEVTLNVNIIGDSPRHLSHFHLVVNCFQTFILLLPLCLSVSLSSFLPLPRL